MWNCIVSLAVRISLIYIIYNLSCLFLTRYWGQLDFHKYSENCIYIYSTNWSYNSILLLAINQLNWGILPNQELSVLYGGPTLNYRGHLSLYVPHMLRVNMTRDLAHMQLSDLQGEIRPIRRTSDVKGERMVICRTQWLFFLLKESQ